MTYRWFVQCQNIALLTVDITRHSVIMHCFAHIFNCSINNIADGEINSLINKFVYNLVDDCQLDMAHFVRELASLKENTTVSNGLV